MSSLSCTTDVLQEAERLKQEGNDHFRSKAWEEALAQYKSALGYLPRRKREPPQEPVESTEPSNVEVGDTSSSDALPATPPRPKNEDSPQIVKARAVLNANVAACHVQLVGRLSCIVLCVHTASPSQGEHVKVVEACTEGTTSINFCSTNEADEPPGQHWWTIHIMSRHSNDELPQTKPSHHGLR